jgi:hypothetical protein
MAALRPGSVMLYILLWFGLVIHARFECICARPEQLAIIPACSKHSPPTPASFMLHCFLVPRPYLSMAGSLQGADHLAVLSQASSPGFAASLPNAQGS